MTSRARGMGIALRQPPSRQPLITLCRRIAKPRRQCTQHQRVGSFIRMRLCFEPIGQFLEQRAVRRTEWERDIATGHRGFLRRGSTRHHRPPRSGTDRDRCPRGAWRRRLLPNDRGRLIPGRRGDALLRGQPDSPSTLRPILAGEIGRGRATLSFALAVTIVPHIRAAEIAPARRWTATRLRVLGGCATGTCYGHGGSLRRSVRARQTRGRERPLRG